MKAPIQMNPRTDFWCFLPFRKNCYWFRWGATLLLIVGHTSVFTKNVQAQLFAEQVSGLSSPSIVANSTPIQSQGSQISFNGRIWFGAWSQWQLGNAVSVRTGISDAALMQQMGFELLDTQDANNAAVRWFSDPTGEPLVLATRITQKYRYLDITELAAWAGWQVRVNGDTLEITTPPVRINRIRQGEQSWGDRIVLDLDRPTTWQVQRIRQDAIIDPEDPNPARSGGTEKSEQPLQEFVVTIDAELAPDLLPQFSSSPLNTVPAGANTPGDEKPLSSLIASPQLTLNLQQTGAIANCVQTASGQTTIRVTLPLNWHPRIWTQPNPRRLIIDIRPDSEVEQDILWSQGVRWRRQLLQLGPDRFPVTSLEVDLNQPGVRVQPIWSDPTSVVGIGQLPETALQWEAIAAINGGFFNRNNHLPLGAIRSQGIWLSSPILNRGAIAWNDAGDVAIARLTLEETLSIPNTGQSWPLRSLNSGYIQAGIARYTSAWGSTYTSLSNQEVIVTIKNHQVISQQVAAEAGQTTVPIPLDGYLLILRSFDSVAAAFAPNTPLKIESQTTPRGFDQYPYILGAGPVLLTNGQIVLDAKTEQFSENFREGQASRSAIGRNANGRLVIATVHNRVNGVGPTLTEMAQIMQQLGAIDALNLDGGNSTTLYLGGQLLEHPPRIIPRVHNGLGIFLQPSP